MRRIYVVTYDIGDPKRLHKVYKLMRGYGEHLQLSVFLCELSDKDRATLEGRLKKIIHEREDQVLFADLGLAEGRAPGQISALGKRYEPPEQVAIIV